MVCDGPVEETVVAKGEMLTRTAGGVGARASSLPRPQPAAIAANSTLIRANRQRNTLSSAWSRLFTSVT